VIRLDTSHSGENSSWQKHANEIESGLLLAAAGVGAIGCLKGEGLSGIVSEAESLGRYEVPALAGAGDGAGALFCDAYRPAMASASAAPEIAKAEPIFEQAQGAAESGLRKPGMIKPAERLGDGAKFNIFNPKTGSTIETSVQAGSLKDGKQYAVLSTADGKLVGNVAYSGSAPGYMNEVDCLYGTPPTNKPFLWLDRLAVEPDFRGQGVREALVNELVDHSKSLGYNGRMKLFAYINEGSISAIPWYKSGFRPVDGVVVNGDRLKLISDYLETTLALNKKVPAELGSVFDNLMMELPEKQII
jgi:GNAT superfamily N-acetyltransferase